MHEQHSVETGPSTFHISIVVGRVNVSGRTMIFNQGTNHGFLALWGTVAVGKSSSCDVGLEEEVSCTSSDESCTTISFNSAANKSITIWILAPFFRSQCVTLI